MRGGSAKWEVKVLLTDGARLTWLGEPFVVSSGADVIRSTTVALQQGCSATLRQSLVLGRTGEEGGSLTVKTRASLDGVPLLVEDIDLSRPVAADRPSWGHTGPWIRSRRWDTDLILQPAYYSSPVRDRQALAGGQPHQSPFCDTGRRAGDH